MKRYIKILKPNECNFFFYKENGHWGKYAFNYMSYWVCIPYVIGIRYVESWGNETLWKDYIRIW